ncbi:hypothetical protein [Streptomyces sp. BRA346]|uniref:hypothetical protein n=1 Tax=Streptomyces sp. BRA346 TaxID=2878199 RepID=UPI004063E84D
MYEMKRLGRGASELTALAEHLTAHGLVLETPSRPSARHTSKPSNKPTPTSLP